MQEENVISYELRQLRPHKVNYPMHDIELVVVIIICMDYRVRFTTIVKT